MSDKSYSLGILFEDEACNGLTHDFFAAVLNGFKKEAESMDMRLLLLILIKMLRAENHIFKEFRKEKLKVSE